MYLSQRYRAVCFLSHSYLKDLSIGSPFDLSLHQFGQLRELLLLRGLLRCFLVDNRVLALCGTSMSGSSGMRR